MTEPTNQPAKELAIPCPTPRVQSQNPRDIAKALLNYAASLNGLVAIGDKYHLPVVCEDVRMPTLIIDGNQVPAIQNILTHPVLVPHSFDRRTGAQNTKVDAVALQAQMDRTKFDEGEKAARSGLSHEVAAATGIYQQLPVKVTQPKTR